MGEGYVASDATSIFFSDCDAVLQAAKGRTATRRMGRDQAEEFMVNPMERLVFSGE